MLIMTLEKVPPRLRGELTRWLMEIQTGVYAGKVSATIRDLLWKKAISRGDGGRISQAWASNNEQGFSFRVSGDSKRICLNFDGIYLLARKNASSLKS